DSDHSHDIRCKLAGLGTALGKLRTQYRTAVHDSIKDTQVTDAYDALESAVMSVARATGDVTAGRPVELPAFALKDGRSAFIKNIADPDDKAALLAVQKRVRGRYNEVDRE